MENQEQSHRILVADDEPEVIDLVTMMLEMGGYTVLSASDGMETLDCVRADLPDLVLLDVRMPGMSGLEVLDQIRREATTAAIPVIMLSVVTTYPEVRDALNRGAVAYLSKPFELKEMMWLVGRVLDMDATEQEALRQRSLKSVGKEW